VHSTSIVQSIRRTGRLGVLVAGVLAVLLGTGVAVGMATTGAASPGPPPASIGDQMDRPMTPELLDAQFTDQEDAPVQLSAYAGDVVVLVPFLTSCQEECPVTTGALLAIRRDLVADHLEHKVTLVEVTVDPGRDTPARMAAYAKLTGVSWPLLTAPPGTIAALWHYFGIYYQVVPEGTPPGIDWQTHQPYAYDVDHSDGFIVLDSELHERFVAAGMVRDAHLTPPLRRLLDGDGLHDLTHPGGGSWTIAQALGAIAWVLGQNVAPSSPAE
jgi:protein SCO1